jgi:carbamoyltransferase
MIPTNGDGFRSNHEFVRSRRPNTKRILLFGDSFTAGDGVSNGQRYSDQLEGLVEGLEVFNYGLPGTGTDQQYLAYGEFSREIEHDLLVIAVLVENVRRVVARYRPFLDESGGSWLYAKPYYELVHGNLVLRGVPVPPMPLKESEVTASERGRLI